MKKYILISFSFLFLMNLAYSQNYITVYQENSLRKDNPFFLSRIATEITAFRNSWENQKKREDEVIKAQSQLALIKKTYDDAGSYPNEIIDGWHLVMATDNHSYCSSAKVLVENNQIIEFVISNWDKLSIPFHVLSPIENAKALITLDFNERTDVLELYFINYLRQPTLTDKPLSSGYITFWSDVRKAERIKVWFEGVYHGNISERSKVEPNCGESAITLELKPGVYSFEAAGRGRIAWEGAVEIKENSCLNYELSKENRTK